METHRVDSQLSLAVFQKIVVGQGQIKHPARRTRDILRVFEESCWIARSPQNQDILCLTENFHKFIRGWDSGNYLLPMNQALTNYSSLRTFPQLPRAKKKRLKFPNVRIRSLEGI